MTLYKIIPKPGSDCLQSRLGGDVYKFLLQSPHSDDFLSDYEYLSKNVKPSAEVWQLSDYSILILPLVKFYESGLWLVCEKMDLFGKLNGGKKPSNLRSFVYSKESEIKHLIDSKVVNQHDAAKIHRKLFSVIDDYDKRNEAVHCGELLSYSGLSNYDSLITTLKELIEMSFENNLLPKN